jgi:catechol 2,3-dioxygenase-like lactoylglutathione lyase family enzyme
MAVEHNIEKLLRDVQNGTMNRRVLLQALGLSATSAIVASALPKVALADAPSVVQSGTGGGKTFPVTTINHLALAVTDYAKSRDFYVDLFGMRVAWDDGKGCALEFGSLTSPNGMYIRSVSKPGEKPLINHIAFGIPDFMTHKMAMKAEMERRGLTNIRPDGERGWSCNDPAGYMLNIWVPEKDPAMFPGAASPCADANSTKCKDAFQVGLKNLSAVTKPSGKGFKGTSFSHVVLNVPAADIAKEREFYSNCLGMKAIYDQPADPAVKQNAQVFLRFGRNTLYLRPTAKTDDKPYCNHFAFVIENFDQTKVEAELRRRGFDPKPDSKLAWTIADPDGFRIEVAGWGLPEHIANDCHGANSKCPGGAKG